MKIPNLENAYVPPEKITDYLLNTEHENGAGKAQFFMHFGFSVTQWNVLADALIVHANAHEVVKQDTTRFGTRYVVEGVLQTPIERLPWIRAVWFISVDEQNPHLVTAYPLEEKT